MRKRKLTLLDIEETLRGVEEKADKLRTQIFNVAKSVTAEMTTDFITIGLLDAANDAVASAHQNVHALLGRLVRQRRAREAESENNLVH